MGQVVDFNHEDQTVFQYLASSFPSTETRIRDRLARFGFREEAMIKQLKALSGGERHRLHLCSLLEQKPDLLVLDEPTNHLDIESRHLLEQALADFHGAVIVVSHDRYFIRTVARSILGFVGHEVHPFTDYQDWYLEHRRLEDQQAGQIAVKAGESPRVAVRRIRARQRQAVTDITQRIKTLEEACRLFEQKAPDKLQDDDYQLYALQLVELEELYQAYIELDEAMADEA
jgi:ATP-binding cassette subfamily F protein 3